ncbi:hypothetical protein Tco_1064049 [Tanacetum coccineum]
MVTRKPITKVLKVRKGKSSLQLVNEPDEEPQPALEPQIEDGEYNLQRGIQMSLESFQAPVGGVAIHEPASGITRSLLVVKGKGKVIATDEQRRAPVTEEASTGPSAQPEDDTYANIVCDTPSPPDAKTGVEAKISDSEGDTEILNVGDKKGKDVSNTVVLEERIVELDEGQAGSDPSNTLESRPPPDEDQARSNPRQNHKALAGPKPEPMHDDFIATVYPKVHESLKHTTEEHVFLDNPPSSSETLDLVYFIHHYKWYSHEKGAQSLLNFKSLIEKCTANLIHLLEKGSSGTRKNLRGPSANNLEDNMLMLLLPYGMFLYDQPTEEEPGKVNVETKVESLVIVPIHQASLTAPPLSTPVIDLTQPKPVSPPIQEPIFIATIATTTTTLPPPPPPQQQSTTDSALAARNHDLYSKIDKYINENVKDAIQDALKDPVCERFGELSEFEMKEILHDRMFESGSYRSQPEHTALYEALEASMDHENGEEFMDAIAKSRKRCRDDQDPPPPIKDSVQNKKTMHDFDASASQQPQA